jgi:hypothetical protein
MKDESGKMNGEGKRQQALEKARVGKVLYLR